MYNNVYIYIYMYVYIYMLQRVSHRATQAMTSAGAEAP